MVESSTRWFYLFESNFWPLGSFFIYFPDNINLDYPSPLCKVDYSMFLNGKNVQTCYGDCSASVKILDPDLNETYWIRYSSDASKIIYFIWQHNATLRQTISMSRNNKNGRGYFSMVCIWSANARKNTGQSLDMTTERKPLSLKKNIIRV